MLRAYFRSGWAFFIPYLAFYLLYYWLKWPVNPLPIPGGNGRIFPLLHVYWTLHGLHLCMGIIALYFWLQDQRRSRTARSSWLKNFSFLPWILLALIFFIPGAYLEFPADPWEHYARINEWANCINITDHSYWNKSGYFLIYSLVGRIPASLQAFWLDAYYTGTCLLLCWQYFRLATDAGLGRGPSFIFVVLQVLLFGNNIFSFYGYYGISSTVLSQIGAIALVRLGLRAARLFKTGPLLRSLLPVTALGILLLLLIALNHIQGLGIAGLELAGIAVWRLIEWKRSAIWWFLTAALALSMITIYWLPHLPALDSTLRPAGWLTSWYGFNVFSLTSPAQDRALQILGFFGVINLVAGLLLLCRNHIVGWLTIMPVLALCLPFIAIPFSETIASDIIVFQRMLLGIPAGLALIVLILELKSFFIHAGPPFFLRSLSARLNTFTGFAFALACFVVVPPNGPFYNRTWSALAKPPDDLTMRTLWKHVPEQLARLQRAEFFAVTSGLGFMLDARRPISTTYSPHHYRIYNRDGRSPAADLELIHRTLTEYGASGHVTVVVANPTAFYTPASEAALCSGHWLPQEAVLATSGAKELHALTSVLGLRPEDSSRELTVYQTDQAHSDKSSILLRSYSLSQILDRDFPKKNVEKEPSMLVGYAPVVSPWSLISGIFSVQVRYIKGPEPYSSLLAIDSYRRNREIYIYVDCQTNEIYYSFSGQVIGPAPIKLVPGSIQTIEFRWADHRQELLLNGRMVLASQSPAPQTTVNRVFVGGSDEGEIWHGELNINELYFPLVN